MDYSHSKITGACFAIALMNASFSESIGQEYRGRHQPSSAAPTERAPSIPIFHHLLGSPPPSETTHRNHQALNEQRHTTHEGARTYSTQSRNAPQSAPEHYTSADPYYVPDARMYEQRHTVSNPEVHSVLKPVMDTPNYSIHERHTPQTSETPERTAAAPGWDDLALAIGTIGACIHNAIEACNRYLLIGISMSIPYFLRKGAVSVARNTMANLRSEAHLGDTTIIER